MHEFLVRICYPTDTIVFSAVARDIHRVLQTIQIKLISLCVGAERAILGSAKTALKFKYEI